MCYYRRFFFRCGCPLVVMLDRCCNAYGTPQCVRRHLLERVFLNINCRHCWSLMPPSPNRRRNRRGGHRSSSGLIIRRRSGSNGSNGSNGGGGGGGSGGVSNGAA